MQGEVFSRTASSSTQNPLTSSSLTSLMCKVCGAARKGHAFPLIIDYGRSPFIRIARIAAQGKLPNRCVAAEGYRTLRRRARSGRTSVKSPRSSVPHPPPEPVLSFPPPPAGRSITATLVGVPPSSALPIVLT